MNRDRESINSEEEDVIKNCLSLSRTQMFYYKTTLEVLLDIRDILKDIKSEQGSIKWGSKL